MIRSNVLNGISTLSIFVSAKFKRFTSPIIYKDNFFKTGIEGETDKKNGRLKNVGAKLKCGTSRVFLKIPPFL
jgi:hypothetical protein